MTNISINLSKLNKQMLDQILAIKDLNGEYGKNADGTYSVKLLLFNNIDNDFAEERRNTKDVTEYALYSK